MNTVLLRDLADVCVAPYLDAMLTDLGAGPLRATWDDTIRREHTSDVRALITGSHAIDARQLSEWQHRFPNLSMLSLAFTGHDRVDTNACRDSGLAVYYVPAYATNAVAEHALGLALAVLRRSVMGCISARAGTWDDGVAPGYELEGKRVGIAGTGAIGMKAAEKFAALGCTLLAWTPKRPGKPEFLALGGKYVETPDRLFAECDIVTLHVKSTPETWQIASAERIGLMRPTSVLINTGRGKLVDNHALARALETRSIFGAGIDVYDTDPIRGQAEAELDPLLRLDPSKCNLVATPHVAFKEDEALRRLAETVLANVESWLSDPASTKNRLV